jgi:LPXTG-site transpeptidase (sortase) family protein
LKHPLFVAHMTKDKKKIFVRIIVCLAVVIFLGFIAASVLYAPPDGESVPQAVLSSLAQKSAAAPSTPSYNMELSIPSVGIDAKVQQVGVTLKGNIGTPNNFTDVAWFSDSPVPGQNGTSVIDGHVDNGLSLPAVFWNLKDVTVGDDVYVDTKDEGTVHFVVTNIQTYDFNAPTDAILAPSPNPTLKLITCAGVYVAALKTHNKRLVVTAERVDS